MTQHPAYPMSMEERTAVAKAAAAGLRKHEAAKKPARVMIGFDGFIDNIISIVDKRHNVDEFDPIPTIDGFGSRISAAAGKSANFELVTKQQKLGGNGPIMSNAMASAGSEVTYVGAVGRGTVHPVFSEFAQQAKKVYTLLEPGQTDALEFSDGKLMMGKYSHLIDVNDALIHDSLGLEAFRQIVAGSELVGLLNWTMMPGTESIWKLMLEKVLPDIGEEVETGHGNCRRMVFFDLCDPAKRTREDIATALELLTQLQNFADVVLGLNMQEASEIAEVLGIEIQGSAEEQIGTTASAIRAKLAVHCVVVHPRSGAAAARQVDGKAELASFAGPFVEKPVLSTGAGDNFNAGFCLGLLAGLPLDQCLCVGTGTSGFYVRNAVSPKLEQLAAFCDDLPSPQ